MKLKIWLTSIGIIYTVLLKHELQKLNSITIKILFTNISETFWFINNLICKEQPKDSGFSTEGVFFRH